MARAIYFLLSIYMFCAIFGCEQRSLIIYTIDQLQFKADLNLRTMKQRTGLGDIVP